LTGLLIVSKDAKKVSSTDSHSCISLRGCFHQIRSRRRFRGSKLIRDLLHTGGQGIDLVIFGAEEEEEEEEEEDWLGLEASNGDGEGKFVRGG